MKHRSDRRLSNTLIVMLTLFCMVVFAFNAQAKTRDKIQLQEGKRTAVERTQSSAVEHERAQCASFQIKVGPISANMPNAIRRSSTVGRA